MIKKISQLPVKPNAVQPSAPTNILIVKIGFLKSLVSAKVPKIGPIIATNKVAILVAYPQYAK